MKRTELQFDIYRLNRVDDTKGSTKSRIRRRTDNTMVKRKRKKHKQRSANITQKTKDQVPQTTLKLGVKSGAPEMLAVFQVMDVAS